MKPRSLVLALLCVCGTTAIAQTFRADADAVRVDVLVTDGNVPVAGLTAADFEIRDNGVVQQVDALALEDVPLSMMLVLDTSYSVHGEALAGLQRAALTALDSLHAQDRAALMTFSSPIDVRAPWTGDIGAVRQAVGQTRAAGGTSLWDAAFAAFTLRDLAPARRSLILLFSDGRDTSSWLPLSAVVDRAKRSDAVLYAVGIGAADRPDAALRFRSGIKLTEQTELAEPALTQLTDVTGGRRLRAGDLNDLAKTFQRVITEFRTRYLLTFAPRNVAHGGWHTLDVRLKARRGQIRARRGYLR